MVRRTRSSLIAAALLVAVAACGSPSPSGTAPPGSAQPGDSASSSESAASPGAPPITAGPAWTDILGAIDADGKVSRDTALQAFAIASGVDMPGVTVPAGDAGTIASGTMALRWLVSYWDEVTADQRAAAIATLPELAGLETTSGVPTARLAAAQEAPHTSGFPGAAQHRTNAYYTQLAKLMAADIGPRLDPPITLHLAIDAHFGLTEKADSGMETGVFDAKGGKSGPAAKCAIVVSWLGDAQAEKDVDVQMAHEVWHCFEGQIVGPSRYWSQDLAPWIQEGEAEWVGNSVVPDAPLGAQAYWDYFFKPDLPLFSRAYDAVGFYAHLNDAGLKPWSTLKPILEAKSNGEAFKAAGATADAFLDTWASSLLRDGRGPAAWQMTGPALPDEARAKPVEIHLSNGGSVGESAAAYANEIAVFRETPDVLLTTFAGRARLSDNAGHDYVAGDSGTYCMLPTGCECPGAGDDQQPPPLTGDAVAIGVTGGTKGTTGTLDGMKLDDWCTGITGTWEGVWQNSERWGGATGGFTMKAVQKGAAFTGTTDVTGPTCVRHGKVNGTVVKGHISMGWLAAGVRDVQFEGTVSGRTMSGTWTAIACNSDLAIDGSWSATKAK